jgi:hypothetical protein
LIVEYNKEKRDKRASIYEEGAEVLKIVFSAN